MQVNLFYHNDEKQEYSRQPPFSLGLSNYTEISNLVQTSGTRVAILASKQENLVAWNMDPRWGEENGRKLGFLARQARALRCERKEG